MKRLARGLWLLAWTLWLWLGVGLYRELPRAFGEAIATLPLKDRMSVGFIGDSNHYAYIRSNQDKSSIEVFDAETGSLVFASPEQKIGSYLWSNPYSVEHPALLAQDVPSEGEGYSIFDFKMGKWRHISNRNIDRTTVHTSKPWVLIFDGYRGNPNRPQQVVVLNWETGKETIVCEIPPTHMVLGRMAFLENPDRAVFRVRDRLRYGLQGDFEVWKLDDPPVLEKRLPELPIPSYPSYSNTGRLAFAVPVGSSAVEVYDLNSERFVFANFPTGERPPEPVRAKRAMKTAAEVATVVSPVLSPSGRTVFGGKPKSLWNVDSGRVLWTSNQPAHVEEVPTRIFVIEDWRPLFRTWLPNFPYNVETLAVRDMETGRLIVRMRTVPKTRGTTWNARATLAVGGDRATPDLFVYRIPQTPNWLLFALCQTILALPLVLLWAVLRWRRRRKAVDRQQKTGAEA